MNPKPSTLNPEPLVVPKHIAIIMDGNRRWARERNLPILEGHRRVANDMLEPLVSYAADCGIDVLTFWAFSTENWQRDEKEVQGIMFILRQGLKTFGMRMHKQGVRIRVIGDIARFPPDIQKTIDELVALTKENKKITVVFALNYGGRDEILRAINKWSTSLDDRRSTINDLSSYLDTASLPDPDMIVRTGGEQRLSGFLPWQGVYSELYFPTWYMPEFTPEKLDEVIEEYRLRQRRFGK